MSKRKNRNNLRTLAPNWKVPVPSSQTVVTVQSVAQNDAQTLDWTFNNAVSSVSSASALPAQGAAGGAAGLSTVGSLTAGAVQLQASGDGVTFVSPTSVSLVGGAIRAVYAGPVISPGGVFNVTGTPTGVAFAGGGTLGLPQSGQVVPQQAAAESAAKVAAKAAKAAKAERTAAKKAKATPARKAKRSKSTRTQPLPLRIHAAKPARKAA